MKLRKIPKQIWERAKKIRLLAMDVDGVLTDGSIIVLDSGEEVKFWNVRDRLGFGLLKLSSARFYTTWITARKSRQVRTRANEIGVDVLYQHCKDKGQAFTDVMKKFKLRPDQAAYIGDDLVDLPALRRAGLAVCPADAPAVLKRACHWTTRAPGGRGVLREVIDAVLQAQGLWDSVVSKFEKPA